MKINWGKIRLKLGCTKFFELGTRENLTMHYSAIRTSAQIKCRCSREMPRRRDILREENEKTGE